MTKTTKQVERRITADELLAVMGPTPADNREGYPFVVPWKSKLAGGVVKSMIKLDKLLESFSNPIYGPFALTASWQRQVLNQAMLDPVKQFARFLTLTGRNPDIFSEMNSGIYLSYAHLTRSLCSNFIVGDRFDMEKARHMTSSEDGKSFLKQSVEEFAFLEKKFNSLGLTPCLFPSIWSRGGAVLKISIGNTPLTSRNFPKGPQVERSVVAPLSTLPTRTSTPCSCAIICRRRISSRTAKFFISIRR
jgi:hypothetical protein